MNTPTIPPVTYASSRDAVPISAPTATFSHEVGPGAAGAGYSYAWGITDTIMLASGKSLLLATQSDPIYLQYNQMVAQLVGTNGALEERIVLVEHPVDETYWAPDGPWLEGEWSMGPALAAPLADGGALLYWDVYAPGSRETSQVAARLVDAQGHVQAEALSIVLPEEMAGPGISRLMQREDGTFLLVRASETGIQLQTLDAAGQALAAPEVISSDAPASVDGTAVWALSDGLTLITWLAVQGEDLHLMGRLLSPEGVPLDEAFALTDTPVADYEISSTFAHIDADGHLAYDIATFDDGGFVAVWGAADGDEDGIFGQIFGADGAPAGPRFIVNDTIPRDQRNPRVAVTEDGGFVVAWTGEIGQTEHFYGSYERQAAFLRVFDGTGQPTGSAHQLHNAERDITDLLDIQVSPDGQLLSVWREVDTYGSYFNMYTTRYVQVFDLNARPEGTVVLAGMAETGRTLTLDVTGLADADGLGSLSYTWYRDGVLVPWAVDDSYTLSDADWGSRITAGIAYTDGKETREQLFSQPTGPVLQPGLSAEAQLPTPGPDRLEGTQSGNRTDLLEGDDAFNALAGDDTVLGGGGDDTLIGGLGSDHLEGGTGNDILIGEDVRDMSATHEGQIFRLYAAAFGRMPDASGFADWLTRLDSGAFNLTRAGNAFVTSREFQNTYGDLEDADFVALLYRNVLDRDPDAAGLADWLTRLDAGQSRAQILLGFAQSAEFKRDTNALASAFPDSLMQIGESIDEVYRLYRATLNRDPDAAGLEDWATALSSGVPLASVTSSFLRSKEFRNTYGDLEDTAFVTTLYQNVLNRDPDAAGLASWLDRLEGGTDRAAVVLGFVQSLEFRKSTTTDLARFMNDLGGDTLVGGPGDDVLAGSFRMDHFVFDAAHPGRDWVLHIDEWDTITLRDFGYSGKGEALRDFAEVGDHTLFRHGEVSVVFANTALSTFDDITFLF